MIETDKKVVVDEIGNLLRRNIRSLVPYSSARDEFETSEEARSETTDLVLLDANENALGSVGTAPYHRYPDPAHKQLKQSLAEIKSIATGRIFVGNGSDEAIDLLIRAFCAPGRDRVLVMPPTYGMYGVCARVNDVAVTKVPLTPEFAIDVDAVLGAVDNHTKLLFVCSPNNPTGQCFKAEAIELLLRGFPGIVVLDEAYIDFCEQRSWLRRLDEFPRLVILQTLSKAWGLAGIRLGFAFGQPALVDVLDRMKPPYNVSSVNQEIALRALRSPDRKASFVRQLVAERDKLRVALERRGGVKRVYRSDANFLLVRTTNAGRFLRTLKNRRIIVRDRSSEKHCKDCVRVTVGTAAENARLIDALGGDSETVVGPGKPREAVVRRVTKETEVYVALALDGRGETDIECGIGFLDHMLEQLARHSLCDLTLSVRGDLRVDAHHTVEDAALALGEAFSLALGEKRGIERYGFMLPMDESLARVAVDFSGRSYLVWDASFARERIGEMPTELFPHFFKSFCDAAGCNLNIQVRGENEHHKIEAIFKAVGRSIRQAVRHDPWKSDVPSTKGSL